MNFRSIEIALTKYSRQLWYMYKKCATLQLRYWQSTLTQVLLAPFASLLLLFILQAAVNNLVVNRNTSPAPVPLKALAPCSPAFQSNNPCISVMYTPADDPVFAGIMDKFVRLNNKRLGQDLFRIETDWTPTLGSLPNRRLSVVAVPNAAFIYDHTDKFQNVTNWGIVFNRGQSQRALNGQVKTVTDIQYQLWYNVTDTQRKFRVSGAPPFVIGSVEPMNDDVVAMTRALDEAIIAYAKNDEELHLDVQVQNYPDLGTSTFQRCPPNPDSTFRTIAPVFMFVPMCVIFFSFLNTIVNEKEKNLKDAMKTIGLQDSIYWLSHFLAGSVVVVLNALLMTAIGRAFGFNFFIKTDFDVMFTFFLLYGWASLSFALFLSSISPRVKVAIGLGFFIVIIGVIYIGVGSLVTYIWYTESGNPDVLDLSPVWKTLMFFPFFNYNKFVFDAFSVTNVREIRNGTKCTLGEGSQFGWEQVYGRSVNVTSQLGSIDNDLVPPASQSLDFFVMNMFLWGVLAWYLDKVMPNDNGYSEHPLFFLFPSFYGYKNPEWITSKTQFGIPNKSRPLSTEDPDVTAERKDAQMNGTAPEIGLRVVGLHKRYYSGLKALVSWFMRLIGKDDGFLENWSESAGATKTAVHELSLTVKKGEMLALLGSNGAGKTSTMKILYGVSPASQGILSVFGLDVNTEMTEIRKILGVCPQFDLLFPDLTAEEHIELFAGIKGIQRDEMLKVSEQRLKHMKLWNVRHQRSGQYSGGMKRRLSVILSTLGDPMMCLYDEPTTGMDPVNKRYVWSFLEQFKVGRVVILTTHSMEEADILADKIAIMAKGRLRAIGKSIRLKNKFGDGYRISLLLPKSSDVPSVRMQIERLPAKVKLVEEEYVGREAKESLTIPKNPDATDTSVTTASESTKMGDAEKAPDQIVPSGQAARLVYGVSSVQDAKVVVQYLEKMTANRDEADPSPVASFGMSQTTLEDVFLKTVQDAK